MTFQAVLKVSADQATPLPSAGDEVNEVEHGIELGYVMNYANRGVTSKIGTGYLAQWKGAGGDPLDFWASDPDGMRVALGARTAEIKNEVQERMVAA